MRVVGAVLAAAGVIAAGNVVSAQAIDPGRKAFESRCARCHGADGNGGEMGPRISTRLPNLDAPQLSKVIRDGIPTKGMPPIVIDDRELGDLVKFVRTLERREEDRPVVRARVAMADGRTLDGVVLGEGFDDMQLRTDDGRVHLLRRAGDRFRSVTSDPSWPTYNGDPGGNRYTTLTQIDKTTVARLAPKWMFTVPDAGTLQMTPVVVDGIMYVTAPNECYALDAGSGRQIWHFKRPRTKGVQRRARQPRRRRRRRSLFMVTDHAHLIALNRFTGELLWDTELDDWRKNYAASSAPLTAGDLVISGVAGGEHGANGFVAAHDQATGKEVWRFWTVPKRGQPGSETWQGKDIDHGGAPTWFTGSYDPTLDLVYWPTGNPSKEYDGNDRKGDNLYANCILALDRKTGALRWHYQFTPHDLWDWDATQTSVLVDADWQGTPRQLMLHAARNGFFYVFDRRDGDAAAGEAVRQEPDVGQRHRRRRPPDQAAEPGAEPGRAPRCARRRTAPPTGSRPRSTPRPASTTCRRSRSAASTRRASRVRGSAGKSYLGGSQRIADDPKPQRVLKAIDIRTGAIAWELPQPGPALSWGGTLDDGDGPRHLRRGGRRPDGRRCRRPASRCGASRPTRPGAPRR